MIINKISFPVIDATYLTVEYVLSDNSRQLVVKKMDYLDKLLRPLSAQPGIARSYIQEIQGTQYVVFDNKGLLPGAGVLFAGPDGSYFTDLQKLRGLSELYAVGESMVILGKSPAPQIFTVTFQLPKSQSSFEDEWVFQATDLSINYYNASGIENGTLWLVTLTAQIGGAFQTPILQVVNA